MPILMYIIFVAGSYAGVIHMDPPPCIHASAYFAESAFSLAMSRFRFVPSGVVSDQRPNQPLTPPSSARAFGAGIVYHVHINAPVPALYAFTNPRMPYSAPDTPMITLSSMARGAIVSV